MNRKAIIISISGLKLSSQEKNFVKFEMNDEGKEGVEILISIQK